MANSNEARKWLENKGWILSGENYNQSKTINMLLTISFLPKILPEIAHAVRAVAFLLEDNITDNISATLAASITDKMNEELSDTKDALSRSQSFFEASSSQQVSTLLELKDITAKLSENTNKLNNLAISLSNATPSPTNKAWPVGNGAGFTRGFPTLLFPNLLNEFCLIKHEKITFWQPFVGSPRSNSLHNIWVTLSHERSVPNIM